MDVRIFVRDPDKTCHPDLRQLYLVQGDKVLCVTQVKIEPAIMPAKVIQMSGSYIELVNLPCWAEEICYGMA